MYSLSNSRCFFFRDCRWMDGWRKDTQAGRRGRIVKAPFSRCSFISKSTLELLEIPSLTGNVLHLRPQCVHIGQHSGNLWKVMLLAMRIILVHRHAWSLPCGSVKRNLVL